MLTVIAVAGGAALASIVGGVAALVRAPTSLVMSVVFGVASGVLIGTVTLEMVPEALERGSVAGVSVGLGLGFVAVWVFDLYINRWRLAGEHAAQYARVRAYHRSHRPRGDRVTVLAGGTSAEELIEGLAIGAGVAVEPEVGLLIAAAIAVDNLSEGMSVGEFVVSGRGAGPQRSRAVRRTLAWTGLIGASLFVSACLGWLALRDVDEELLGVLLATGGGGMLYLTVSALVPPSEEQQYQGSGALATGAGFLLILVLTAAG
jgi:zinc transporter, ZIP family